MRTVYSRVMDLVILGDTHELHREVEVPAGSLLIFTGDFTMFSKSKSAIEDFNEWLGELPHLWKLIVPGNHESFLEADLRKRSMISNATVLIDEMITIDGLKIYGSPMTPLYGGAFGKSSATDRTRHWAKVPSDTHILITHGPPYLRILSTSFCSTPKRAERWCITRSMKMSAMNTDRAFGRSRPSTRTATSNKGFVPTGFMWILYVLIESNFMVWPPHTDGYIAQFERRPEIRSIYFVGIDGESVYAARPLERFSNFTSALPASTI